MGRGLERDRALSVFERRVRNRAEPKRNFFSAQSLLDLHISQKGHELKNLALDIRR